MPLPPARAGVTASMSSMDRCGETVLLACSSLTVAVAVLESMADYRLVVVSLCYSCVVDF